MRHLETYDWIIFTSSNTVQFFFQALKKYSINKDILINTKFAVVGSKVGKTLRTFGFEYTLIPQKFTADDLLSELLELDLKNKKLLIPKSNLAKDIFTTKLLFLEAKVDSIVLYETIKPNLKDIQLSLEKLKNSEIDYITFTSPSTVTNFMEILKEYNIDTNLLENKKIVCIGSVTADAIRKEIQIEPLIPDEYTIEGMINKIIEDKKRVSKN